MYGKIFGSMYDGTLAEDWRALVTFQQLIVLCDADGVVDMTPSSISRRTGIPIEHIKAGIEVLENPDKYSRTEGEEGRRITRIDAHRPWGWVIVNHKKYKHLQDSDTIRAQTRERVRRHRENKKCNVTVTEANVQKRHTDTDTNTYKTKKTTSSPTVSDPVPFAKIIDLYHKKLPQLPKVEKLTNTRKGYIRQRWLEDLKTLGEWENYFDYVNQSAFLMGRVKGSIGKPPFRATLEWLTKPGNYAKVAEEKYHGR